MKTLRDGIAGNAQLTLNTSAGGYTISSPAAIIGGTVSIILNEDLRLTSGVTIPTGSSVNISGISPNNIAKGAGGIFLVNGAADMNSTNISNTSGSVTINGTLKTSNPNGLYGTGATVISGSIILNTNSTIEYNANGPQNVQGGTLPLYYNVTFSGSGTKTLLSANNAAGTITVSGAAIFDAGNSTFGRAGTNLTMTGTSRYITGGGTTKPDAQGTYNLASGTTIEFALNSATVIRLGLSPINYANIDISGTNVSNASTVTGIVFQTGGTFTVKTGATFKLNNAGGFTGNTSTAISSSNNPAVILENGSTIEYSGTTQTITNQLPYQNLTISGTGNKTAPAGILTAQGNLVKSGTSTFVHNSGTVLLNGATGQTFARLTYNNLILTNSIKATSGSSIIIDSIKINTGATLSISASDSITLHSDGTKTAWMAKVDGSINYNTTGKFVVERYISARRAWRFLAVPVTSSQTIRQAWQEGALNYTSDPSPGFGTQITSDRASWLADGFDVFSANGPSMKTYDPLTDNYDGITSTLNSFVPNLGGYMTFIRGNRIANSFGSPVSSTVLRITGSLFTGSQPDINVISGEIIPVNNPYASPLDLRKISTSSQVFYYVWDPNRGGGHGLGAFQTLLWNGTDYDVVPGNSGSFGATNNFIESGQAFFVSTLGADTSLQLNENAKSSATFPISPFFTGALDSKELRVNLYDINADGSTYLADGILANFGDNYSNDIDGLDARKSFNTMENLSIRRGEKLLAIERRHTVTNPDTIFLNLTGVVVQQYQFRFEANNFKTSGVGFLEDNYLHTRTPLNLSGSTLANFSVVNIVGSYSPDRFRIVFTPAVVLPVTFTSIKAYCNGKDVNVQWTVENELNMKQYEVEKSVDGTQFTTLSVKAAAANGGHSASYVATDANPVQGINYYRVKSVDINNKTAYTQVVKVLAGNSEEDIRIFPNPITDGMIHLQLMNQPQGKYTVRLLNKRGQVMASREIDHAGGSSSEIIKWGHKIAHGIYQLEVTTPGETHTSINVMY